MPARSKLDGTPNQQKNHENHLQSAVWFFWWWLFFCLHHVCIHKLPQNLATIHLKPLLSLSLYINIYIGNPVWVWPYGCFEFLIILLLSSIQCLNNVYIKPCVECWAWWNRQCQDEQNPIAFGPLDRCWVMCSHCGNLALLIETQKLQRFRKSKQTAQIGDSRARSCELWPNQKLVPKEARIWRVHLNANEWQLPNFCLTHRPRARKDSGRLGLRGSVFWFLHAWTRFVLWEAPLANKCLSVVCAGNPKSESIFEILYGA